MPLGKFEVKRVGLHTQELPRNFLNSPYPIMAQYGNKQDPMDIVHFTGFSNAGKSVTPAELKFKTFITLVPAYTIKGPTGKTNDISIDILTNPSILDTETRYMANRAAVDDRGFSITWGQVQISKASAVKGDFLKKQLYLSQYIETQIKRGQWKFINEFDVDIPNLRWMIEFNPEKVDTILPLFKAYIDIETIGHSTPRGLLEMPTGFSSTKGRPGPIYRVPGFAGILQKQGNDYLIKTKNQLIAAQGAMYSYLQMSENYSEYGLIKGSQLVDMLLRNGLYGTATLRDAISLLPLFSRCGISPAIYHFAFGALTKKRRIQAVELFILRLWMFLQYIAMLKQEGIDNLETEVTYKFQGRTPPTQDLLDNSFSYGLHPLAEGNQVNGLVRYYYPPTSSLALKMGTLKLITDNAQVKNTISIQSKLRDSKVRQELVYIDNVYADFPDLVDEKVDYAIVSPLNEGQETLRRELYGSPQEFDEISIVGRITTSNGFTPATTSVKLIDTLLFGGQPLCAWDQLVRPVYNKYLTAVVHKNSITDSYADQENAFLDYSRKSAMRQVAESKNYYYGMKNWDQTWSKMTPKEKAQFQNKFETLGKSFDQSDASSFWSQITGFLSKTMDKALKQGGAMHE